MKNVFLYSIFLCLLGGQVTAQTRAFSIKNYPEKFKAGTVIVKLRSNSTSSSNSLALNNQQSQSWATDLSLIRKELKALNVLKSNQPFLQKNNKGLNKKDFKYSLDNIYFLELPKVTNIEKAIEVLLLNENVEYAEPYFLHELFVIPNDPHASPTSTFQYQLRLIKAYEAWDIQRGDSNMIVSIIDTGVLPSHPDLNNNLKYNFSDPINGIDDDEDGYIDNYLGWDFANNDNNVTADKDGHGTMVAGCSNGHTNNGIGIAGTSFNTKFLPLKVFTTADNTFHGGYEAIFYAANHGAKVINLSWGSQGFLSKSQYEQDIINYAVLVKDVVIVAAAGNTHGDFDYYPASYDNVLSVGATNAADEKASFSTYSSKIDICAPGNSVGTTSNAGGYLTTSGTSFSSPIVAGAAALVRRRFPQYNALQVMEQLRVTADDIFSNLPNATAHKEKLGKGRLNMYNAVTNVSTPSLRIKSFYVNNGIIDKAFYDDTVKLFCTFENFLASTSNVKITITSPSQYVTILQNTFTIDNISTLGTKNNSSAPFILYLSPNTPENQKIVIRVGMEGYNYKDFQYIEFSTAPDYLNTTFNSITLTSASNGAIGYRDNEMQYGIGLLSSERQHLGRGGLILSTSPTKVSSNVMSYNELKATRHIKTFKGSYADTETRGTLVDTLSNPDKIGVVVTHKQYGWKAGNDSSYVILEYNITNMSGATIPSLFTGLYADFNIGVPAKNRANWIPENKMGYVFSTEVGFGMVGIALLSNGDSSFFAIDKFVDNGYGVNLSDGLSKSDQYNLLSNGIAKTSAGMAENGSDVAQVLGLKITGLENKKTTKIAFAIIVGNTLEELKLRANRAKIKFNEYQANPPTSLKVGFCHNTSATILRPGNLAYRLFDNLHASTPIYTGNSYKTPLLTENQQYFITNNDEGFESEPTKVIMIREDVKAEFTMDKDTLDLLYSNKVLLTDITLNGKTRLWELEGYTSTNKSTIRAFNKQGTYKITLNAETTIGCKDKTEKTLVVISTSPKPVVSPILICPKENAAIQPINGSTFKFYDQYPLTEPIHVGSTFTTPEIITARSYWVTNIDSTKESEPLQVKINLLENFGKFDISKNTVDLDVDRWVNVKDNTIGAIDWKWITADKEILGENEIYLELYKTGIFPITLIVTHSSGCKDTITKELTVIRKSPKPIDKDISICPNTAAIITYTEGEKYRFYEEGSSIPIFEGNSFNTGLLTQEKQYLITNVDSVVESDPVIVRVKIADVNVDLAASADTINTQDELFLEAQGFNLVKLHWDLGNGKTDSIMNPRASYSIPGEYTIKLLAENSLGCRDSIAKEIVVIEKNSAQELVSIYPNPSKEHIFIYPKILNGDLLFLSMFNYHGEQILDLKTENTTNVIKIDCSLLPIGLYYLKFETRKESIMKKVVLYR